MKKIGMKAIQPGKTERERTIIGAVNYLASKGMNAFSFLTNNIGGDDQKCFSIRRL